MTHFCWCFEKLKYFCSDASEFDFYFFPQGITDLVRESVALLLKEWVKTIWDIWEEKLFGVLIILHHTFQNGFWLNCLRRVISFWCCPTGDQIGLATLKPSISQIRGSFMGEVLLWQMPAALAWTEWIVHLAAYNCITLHGAISSSPCLPHPSFPPPIYSGSDSVAMTLTSS